MSAAAEDKTQRECVFVREYCIRVYRGRGREMKRKSAPRMQEIETPTERRVLIGCLETTASGRRISMHEIYGQRDTEKENRGRDHSNITTSLGTSRPHFDFDFPRCPRVNSDSPKLCCGSVDAEPRPFGYTSHALLFTHQLCGFSLVCIKMLSIFLLSHLPFRVPVFGHAGHGIGLDH